MLTTPELIVSLPIYQSMKDQTNIVYEFVSPFFSVKQKIALLAGSNT